MDALSVLKNITAIPGPSGREEAVGAYVKECMLAYTKDVWQDALGNTMGKMGKEGPVVFVCAHMDEIGLLVMGIEDNGFLRISNVGGVDPRILPGSMVKVCGKQMIKGVIGALPPHLSQGSKKKASAVSELFVDTALPYEKVKELISVGDVVVFDAPLVQLLNGRVAGKTLDDRACLTAMLLCMESLKDVNLHCQVVFCASVQEEVGCRGALVASYGVKPDMAVAFDVTHAFPQMGADESRLHPIDQVTATCGPNIHPAMFRRFCEMAKKENVPLSVAVSAGPTGTDARSIQIAGDGVPTALLEIPLRYMHTSVEMIDANIMAQAGRLLAAFLRSIEEGWEDWLCF